MLSTYRVKVSGLVYTGQYTSACVAIIVAMAIYGTHYASAKKVSA